MYNFKKSLHIVPILPYTYIIIIELTFFVQQMECLIDFINKLKLENHVMKKLCQLRQTKIMNLQNYAHN